MNEEQLKKMDDLARSILIMSRNRLLVKMRFLDLALSMFRYEQYGGTVGTDGAVFYYNPVHVLKEFQSEKSYSEREYLHIVFHCVFRHMFVGKQINRRLWNLACDIAVEHAISDLQIKALTVSKEPSEENEIKRFSLKKQDLTAEKLYRYLTLAKLNKDGLSRLEKLFCYDDHGIWYRSGDDSDTSKGNGGNGSGNQQPKGQNSTLGGSQSQSDAYLQEGDTSNAISLQNRWKDISERMQEELETFAKMQGEKAGIMMQNLREINRERYDYSAFLRKFAVQTEVMKINDDEFDYIFYTYGLNLYKNMPLIEPLEYKDDKRIREFVIAIDTSGSTSGELVQRFLQKTYNILKSAETFSSKINLHIIQCDAEIQEDAKITSQEEFDTYLKSMRIKGLGGTDFRPVFQYVEQLKKSGELIRMKGLIYFTDGYGVFPARKPDYDTAFVFVDDSFNNLDVPSWAIKLVLKNEEI